MQAGELIHYMCTPAGVVPREECHCQWRLSFGRLAGRRAIATLAAILLCVPACMRSRGIKKDSHGSILANHEIGTPSSNQSLPPHRPCAHHTPNTGGLAPVLTAYLAVLVQPWLAAGPRPSPAARIWAFGVWVYHQHDDNDG